MRAFPLVAIAVAICSVVSGCGRSTAPAPVATATLAPVTLAAPKTPLRGLIDMQDISWHNTDGGRPTFDIGNVEHFPGLFGGIVINTTWAQMQPASGGMVDYSLVASALDAVRTYNDNNPSAPLGVKLRIYGGDDAPEWAKELAGRPIAIYRNPAGCGGQIDTCPMTVGAFWTQPYVAAWRAFQVQVAAKYDSVPLIRAVAVTSCAAQTDEPFVASSGPVSKANLQAAGYSDAVEQACLTDATDDYAAWQNTLIDFTFNNFTKIAGGADAAFTQSVMAICRAKAAAGCVLDNHALQAPLTSDLQTYSAIQSADGLINFQTQSPEAMGCIWPETITQGILLGARAIEVWPAANFQGFDSLTVPQVQSLHDLFSTTPPVSTPVPNALPTPCSGFN
jgi:hypothetical protein